MYVMTIDKFEPGDFVTPLDHGVSSTNTFYGVVVDVDPKINKVVVEWNGGCVQQHDPNDLGHYAVLMKPEEIQRRIRGKIASSITASVDTAVGNPENHGTGESGPVTGGFGVMQDLAYKLHDQSLQQAGITASIDVPALRSRRAVYGRCKGRKYQRSKDQIEQDALSCPKCKSGMEKQKFTRKADLFNCPKCGWKITSDKIV